VKRWKWIALAVIGGAQLLQPDRSPLAGEAKHDLIAIAKPAAEVGTTLRTACYDCHSNTATYPWYACITPVNFWLQHHINEGRREFNMSAWGAKTDKWRDRKKHDAVELLQKGEMPLSSYAWMHKEARLNARQRQLLADFFSGL
jgi:hypothetical protein